MPLYPADRRPGDILERMEKSSTRMEMLTWAMAAMTVVNTVFVILAATRVI